MYNNLQGKLPYFVAPPKVEGEEEEALVVDDTVMGVDGLTAQEGEEDEDKVRLYNIALYSIG